MADNPPPRPMNESDDSNNSSCSSSSASSSLLTTSFLHTTSTTTTTSTKTATAGNALLTSLPNTALTEVASGVSGNHNHHHHHNHQQSLSHSVAGAIPNVSDVHQLQHAPRFLANRRGPQEKIRTFVFSTVQKSASGDIGRPALDELSIQIPEQLQSSYSFYTWPCAPILAWYLWERRHSLVGLRVLELGCGTALPGLLAAKCGAKVTLTDSCILSKTLAHIRRACQLNGLVPGQNIEVLGVTWGLLLNSLYSLGRLDLIIAADCFYDPTVFEDILVSISFLLERNPTAKFIFTYQERSADWSIESLLKKWQLCARQVDIDDVGKASGVDLVEILGNHTIYLIEVVTQRQFERQSSTEHLDQLVEEQLESGNASTGSGGI